MLTTKFRRTYGVEGIGRYCDCALSSLLRQRRSDQKKNHPTQRTAVQALASIHAVTLSTFTTSVITYLDLSCLRAPCFTLHEAVESC